MKVFGVTKCGKSHEEINIECQDFSRWGASDDGRVAIVVVADGVGSCKEAKKGAETAGNEVFEFLSNNMPVVNNPDDFEALIRVAMIRAQKAINKVAKAEGNKSFDYCTTLMAAVVFDNVVHYGFSGDGGIVALQDGAFKSITTPQKGPDGVSVITLLSGSEHWEFGKIDDAEAVMIATDGVYDKLVDNWQGDEIYHNLCRALADVDCDEDTAERMYDEAFDEDLELLFKNLERCATRDCGDEGKNITDKIKNNRMFTNALKTIYDDITLVTISIKPSKGKKEDYEEKDFKEILRNFAKTAYPGLGKETNSEPSQGKESGAFGKRLEEKRDEMEKNCKRILRKATRFLQLVKTAAKELEAEEKKDESQNTSVDEGN